MNLSDHLSPSSFTRNRKLYQTSRVTHRFNTSVHGYYFCFKLIVEFGGSCLGYLHFFRKEKADCLCFGVLRECCPSAIFALPVIVIVRTSSTSSLLFNLLWTKQTLPHYILKNPISILGTYGYEI